MSSYEFSPRKHAIGVVSIPCTVDHLQAMVAAMAKFANENSEISRTVRVTLGSKGVIFRIGVEE